MKVHINGHSHEVSVEHDKATDLAELAAIAQALWQSTVTGPEPVGAGTGGSTTFGFSGRRWADFGVGEQPRVTAFTGPTVSVEDDRWSVTP